MLKKLITIICHPSYIGLYILDKASTIFLWILLFFALTTTIVATNDLVRPVFTNQTCIAISDIFFEEDKLNTTTYSNHKLTGDKVIVEKKDVKLVFNDSSYVNDIRDSRLILVFSHSEANAYYFNMNIGKLKYDDININDFNIKEIKDSKNTVLRDDVVVFVRTFLNRVEMNNRSINFFLDIRDVVLYYLLTLLVCFIASIIRNPQIDGRVRRKLIGYDSLIYFLFIWFEVFFQVFWLSYLGICFALVYTILTFSRIKIISRKREG